MMIEGAVSQSGDSVLNNESRAAATHAAHQLAGTLGTFGFWEGSEHAAALERLLLDTETKTDVAGLPELLAVLRAALAARASTTDRSWL